MDVSKEMFLRRRHCDLKFWRIPEPKIEKTSFLKPQRNYVLVAGAIAYIGGDPWSNSNSFFGYKVVVVTQLTYKLLCISTSR